MSKQALYYSLSVHQFVDFLLRQGDIDSRIYNQETMNLGSKLHSAFQAKQGNDYLSEVALSGQIEIPEGTITLQGRADGIIVGGDYPIIDEIKSTVQDVKIFALTQEEWHLGQALCYGYLYLKQNGGDRIGIRLTYLSQVGKDSWVRDFSFSKEEVEAKVEGYARDYFAFMAEDRAHRERRDESVKHLTFPFGKFRPGQREMAKYVYGAISKNATFFSEAPTGIGKTMAALFPAVKSFKDGRVDRLFYFTAKTTGAKAAYEAVGALYKQGFEGRDSYLMAKEKICFRPGASCNPDECPFAKDYYGKLKKALAKAKAELSRFDPDSVSAFCADEGLCPFEFQLDLSLGSDIIIADYNYFFDPQVYLERYFDDAVDSSTYVALIDEAHNLVKRGRDMYSASLDYEAAREAAKAIHDPRHKSLKTALGKIKKALKELDEDIVAIPEALTKALDSYKRAKQKSDKAEQEGAANSEHYEKPGEAYRNFSRDISRFMLISASYYGTNYRLRIQGGKNPSITLYCLDPAPFLSDCLSKIKASVLFSATLTPMNYYQRTISGKEDHSALMLSSPFPKENLALLVAPRVTTRYKVRDRYYEEVARYLKAFVKAKQGNYFLFFPSYGYLEAVAPLLDFGDAEVLKQEKEMDDISRNEFLTHFAPSPDHTTVGLLVLGGAFSEGIDLVSDRLIGVAVVGTGLPQVGEDTEDIRAYYENLLGDGFSYAYLYPGMNKVFQAIGRLIRSEEDVGAALLIDSRFLEEAYHESLLRLYPEYEVVMDEKEIQAALKAFYAKHKD